MTAGVGPPEAPATAPPAAPKMNTLQRLVGAIAAPTRTFEEIARRPDVLWPLLIYFVLGILFVIAIVPRIDFETAMREEIEASGRKLPEEELDRTVRFTAGLAKAGFYASPLIGIAMYAIVAGVLLLTFRLIGGEGNYKQAFSATLYAWVPLVIKSVAMTAVVLARGTVDLPELNNVVLSNPGFLVDPKENAVLFAALSSLDLFTIWSLALFAIAFSYIARVSKAKAAAVIVSWWLVITFVQVGFTALGAAAKARQS